MREHLAGLPPDPDHLEGKENLVTKKHHRTRAAVLWLSGLDMALFIILVGLKSGGSDMSWLWVTAPLWIPGLLGLVFGFAVSRATDAANDAQVGGR